VILSRAEIKPHRTEYWVMTDFDQPYFEERCSEVCGLYLNPPENALVLSIDEKTSIQAKGLARPDTLPVPVPGKRGSARRDYQYTRNGTMNLFAALRVHTGETHAMTSNDPQQPGPDPLPGRDRRHDPAVAGLLPVGYRQPCARAGEGLHSKSRFLTSLSTTGQGRLWDSQSPIAGYSARSLGTAPMPRRRARACLILARTS
jgi:hypothetical protein